MVAGGVFAGRPTGIVRRHYVGLPTIRARGEDNADG